MPANLFVFKTTNESHIGEINYFKVFSGSVSEGMDLNNNTINPIVIPIINNASHRCFINDFNVFPYPVMSCLKKGSVFLYSQFFSCLTFSTRLDNIGVNVNATKEEIITAPEITIENSRNNLPVVP